MLSRSLQIHMFINFIDLQAFFLDIFHYQLCNNTFSVFSSAVSKVWILCRYLFSGLVFQDLLFSAQCLAVALCSYWLLLKTGENFSDDEWCMTVAECHSSKNYYCYILFIKQYYLVLSQVSRLSSVRFLVMQDILGMISTL